MGPTRADRSRRAAEREGVLGTALISVAIGLVVAVAFWGSGLWLQVVISKHGGALAPALMIGSFILRLVILAAIIIPLAVYTDLNLVALLVSLIVVFTALLFWGIYLQVKKANKEESKGA